VAGGHDLESLKDLLKRIGSNLRLSGHTLRVSFENPWAILAQRRKNANWWRRRLPKNNHNLIDIK